MSIRSVWTIGAVAAGLTFSAFAQSTTTTPPSIPTPVSFTRTYAFPPVGLAPTDSASISVTNTAATSANGTKASCSVSISFTKDDGTSAGPATTFTLGTGQIQTATLASFSTSRTEISGSVQVTITPGSYTPCSLLMTLETFDTGSGVTHSTTTSVVEQPIFPLGPLFSAGSR
jgi:hypothetical protein